MFGYFQIIYSILITISRLELESIDRLRESLRTHFSKQAKKRVTKRFLLSKLGNNYISVNLHFKNKLLESI
jgi:hypothetical protein